MATPIEPETLIFDIKLSTVVPASITGEDKAHHQFTAMDLAMKLHYITTVHFFGGDAAAGLSVQDLKAPMFRWLQLYYPICGRIRRHDGGRPFVKCNDSGVRIVEAMCAKTVAEWLAVVGGGDRHGLLVYHQPLLAHEFGFTPLVFLQITRFKCGGIALGMRWAHILGDAFSASECINTWSKIMANQNVPSSSHLNTPTTIQQFATSPPSCRSVKPLDPPLGDNWLTPNNFKMQTHTFHIKAEKLCNLLPEENKYKVTPFEVISAIIWKSMAKARANNNNNNKTITICKKRDELDYDLLGNTHQVIGVVEVPEMGLIRDGDFVEIAKMIGEGFVDETKVIEKRVEEGNGNDDFLVYGSNLTFVDLEEVNLWGLEINGRGPVFADVSIGGVGDEGAVVVVENGGGKTVNVILRDDELLHLKNELRVEYDIL
ncbi:protein eceriferum 1 [Phtheirospermum japonicum]|uniref:Protein eceriferum 1 n=1 Tax=Phtheirospermum japonicum TaxID=374723 RepID=A0A830CST4_9LAMI|nr:protein eceriferum 1 [Phtheirospermum japonicum]